MKKIGICIVCFLLCSYVIEAQNTTKKNRKKNTIVETEQLSDKDKITNSGVFIDAVKERLIGNLNEAEKLILQVIALEPYHDAAHFEYANILAYNQRIPEAIIELKKAIELNNTNIWYKIMLGDLYNMTQNFSESEKLWKSIVEKYPDNLEYLYNYAFINISKQTKRSTQGI
jgi:predicted Zn-dependent protease